MSSGIATSAEQFERLAIQTPEGKAEMIEALRATGDTFNPESSWDKFTNDGRCFYGCKEQDGQGERVVAAVVAPLEGVKAVVEMAKEVFDNFAPQTLED